MSTNNNTTGVGTYVLISPADVNKRLYNLLRETESKELCKGNVKCMRNWVISRPERVNRYQCFVFLGKHCNNIRNSLKHDVMLVLLNTMVNLVQKCLSGGYVKITNLEIKANGIRHMLRNIYAEKTHLKK